MNPYGFNHEIPCREYGLSSSGDHHHQDNGYSFSYCNEFADISAVLQQSLDESHIIPYQLGAPLGVMDPAEVPDIPDTCFNYISNILSEDYSDDRPGATIHDYMAYQASYNKSLGAALLGESSSFLASHCVPPVCQASHYCLEDYMNMLSNTLNGSTSSVIYANAANDNFVHRNTFVGNSSTGNFASNFDNLLENDVVGSVLAPVITEGAGTHQFENSFGFISNENWELNQSSLNPTSSCESSAPIQRFESLLNTEVGRSYEQGNMNIFSTTLVQNPIPQIGLLPSHSPNFIANHVIVHQEVPGNDLTDKQRGRKHNDEGGEEENQETGRNNKLSAPSGTDLCDRIEQYGDVFLCPEGRSKPAAICTASKSKSLEEQEKKSGSASKGSKKRGGKRLVVDLRALLTRCAQCVARVDLTGAYEMLNQIRQHSSPCGDFLQRLAHYLANALEARLEGRGSELCRANEQISPCEVLKANRVFVASVPFKIMSYYTTNKTIASLVEEAPSIHIIDFGIFYGLQWPCIIQNLSKRPNGPPKIRITGIEFPQRGFRPAERVEETGRCLAKYCEKYNVPFEYHAIAKNWETIQLEDLKMERNEPLVVNCLYRSHNVSDESVDDNSPRDSFLKLVRKIHPDIFMHGIVNSTSSVPFFLNRFKEAMFHYSALFDIFEATMSREDEERLLLEGKLYGNQALNVIACEGGERFERPETYKQWQVRTQRAGFKQLPLDRELVRRARAMVRRSFRQEFSYDEDGQWVIQGWKGRIMYAISCWKPA